MACMQWQIPGSDNQPIYGNSHAPDHGNPVSGTLIISHGLMGYKDYGFIPIIAKQLAKKLNFIVQPLQFLHTSGVTKQLRTIPKSRTFCQRQLGSTNPRPHRRRQRYP